MELLVVRTEDVYPDESNPREDFGDIEALAESFDLNAERPGEPFTPPILVRDGGIFRIVDGERRYKALVERGAVSFSANVCESMDEADSVVAMLATDDKMQLSEIEKSRGVQKMLLLGVDPVKVDKAARMERGSAAKVARAREVVDDAAEDMTLDRMYAIAEFADDPEAVDKIMNAKEGDWLREVSKAHTARAARVKLEAMKAKAAEIGAELVPDEEAERMEGYRYDYRTYVGSPEDLEAAFAEHPDAVFGYRGASYYVYLPKQEEAEEDPAEAEARKAAAELVESFAALFSELRAWADAGPVGRGAARYPNMRELLVDGFKECVVIDEVVEAFPSLDGVDGWSRHDMAVGYLQRFPWEEPSPEKARDIMQGKVTWRTGDVVDMAELVQAATLDGFAASEASRAACEAIGAWMAAAGEPGETEDGE